MLTVRNVKHDGRETIIATSEVISEPNNESKYPGARLIQCLLEDGTSFPILDGHVYVMNNSGQTVATYKNIDGNPIREDAN